jgi:hypothetical protein
MKHCATGISDGTFFSAMIQFFLEEGSWESAGLPRQ